MYFFNINNIYNKLIFLKSILNFILNYKIFNILIFSLLKLLKYTVSWKVDARLQKFIVHIKKDKKVSLLNIKNSNIINID